MSHKSTDCECSGPGWCQRHGVKKSRRWFELCQQQPKYFELWEHGRGPGQQIAGRPSQQKRGGPGTELSRMLSRLGIRYRPRCGCHDKARLMDRWGPDKCTEKLETIIDWLEAEAGRRKLKWVFSRRLVSIMVRRAIAKSRRVLASAGNS